MSVGGFLSISRRTPPGRGRRSGCGDPDLEQRVNNALSAQESCWELLRWLFRGESSSPGGISKEGRLAAVIGSSSAVEDAWAVDSRLGEGNLTPTLPAAAEHKTSIYNQHQDPTTSIPLLPLEPSACALFSHHVLAGCYDEEQQVIQWSSPNCWTLRARPTFHLRLARLKQACRRLSRDCVEYEQSYACYIISLPPRFLPHSPFFLPFHRQDSLKYLYDIHQSRNSAPKAPRRTLSTL